MDKRSKWRVILGLVLAVAGLFACLSLISHHASDPGGGDYAPGWEVRNWCGPIGARFSGYMIGKFGMMAAAFAVGLSAFWSYLLLASKERLGEAYLKIIGSALLVVAVSALSALAGGGGHFSSSVGSVIAKGTVGYFGPTGAYLVLALAGVLSLLLATDFLVIAPAGSLALGGVRFLRALLARSRQALRHSLKPSHKKPGARVRVTRPEDVEETVRKKAGAPERAEPRARKPALEVQRRLPAVGAAAAAASGSRSKARSGEGGYAFPPHSLLDDVAVEEGAVDDAVVKEKADVLRETLAEFGIIVEVVGIETGPVITQYEISLAPGIKVTRVISLADDMAMALMAPSVRIVAPIPGRDSIGVEVPNARKAFVNLKGLMEERRGRKAGTIPIFLGRDTKGASLAADLAEMPHLLIAGTTGSGKSVCINAIILSILMQKHPDDVKLLLVDPKMVELASFRDLPHLICPVVTDVKKASAILEWACLEMDARYDYLAAVGVRHISRYNKLGAAGVREKLEVPADAEIELPDKMPYIVIIIDELADLMMLAAKGIETSITRLAQKSRGVGIHLVLATQRPSVDVITGLIKSNLPARIAFQVSSGINSRTILDQNGAEKLLGMGDMLFLPPATAKLTRAQGTFVSDEEIARVTEFVKAQAAPDYNEALVEWKGQEKEGAVVGSVGAGRGGDNDLGSGGSKDALYGEAVRVVIENNRGSVSLLQRRLTIGYGRAARLIDFMAEDGILGPYQGSQAREVLYTMDQWDELQKTLKKSG